MPAKHLEFGKYSEESIVKWLTNKRWSILDRNYRDKFSEIDIIARDGDGALVFVEVKAIDGQNGSGYSPEDHMNRQKIARLQKTCEMFSAKHPGLIQDDRGWRIDLITLTKTSNGVLIKHYENV